MIIKSNFRVFILRAFAYFLVVIFFFVLLSDILFSPVFAEDSDDADVSVDSELVFSDVEVQSVSVDGDVSVASIDSSDFSISASSPNYSLGWAYRYYGYSFVSSIESNLTSCYLEWDSIYYTTQDITLSYNGNDSLYCSYIDVDCYLYYYFSMREYIVVYLYTEGLIDFFIGSGYLYANDYIDVNYFSIGSDYSEDFETYLYSSGASNGDNYLTSDTVDVILTSAGTVASQSFYLGSNGTSTWFRIAVPITLRFYNSDTSSSFYTETHDSDIYFSLSHNTVACFYVTLGTYFGSVGFYIYDISITNGVIFRYSPYISVVGYSYVEDYTSMYNALSSYIESTYTMVAELQTAVSTLESGNVDTSAIEAYLESIFDSLDAYLYNLDYLDLLSDNTDAIIEYLSLLKSYSYDMLVYLGSLESMSVDIVDLLDDIFSCLSDFSSDLAQISSYSAETASTSVEILNSTNAILSKLDSLDDIVDLLNELIDKLDELELDLSIVDDDSVYQETLQEFSDIVNEYADYEGDVNELLLDLSVSLDDFSVSVAIDSNISAGSESLNSWFDLFMQIPLLSSLVVCSLTVSVVFVFIRRKGDSV